MILHECSCLLNLLNELRKSNKMQGLPSILTLLSKELLKFNNVRFYLSYDIKIILKSHFCCKKEVSIASQLAIAF